MSKLGATLTTLRAVAALSGLYIYTFDTERRTFKRIKCYATFVRLCQAVLLVPYLYFTFKSIVILKFYLLDLIKVDLQGEEGLQTFYSISRFFVLARVIYLNVCIGYLYTFGLKRAEKLLGDFVRIHDKYVELFGVAPTFEWGVMHLTCLKMLLYELYQWKCQYDLKERLHLLYIPFSVQPLLITVLCFTALTILHSLYMSTQSMLAKLPPPEQLQTSQIEQLLQFYDQLMALRRDFQACSNIFFGIEYFENLNHLTMAVHGPTIGMSLTSASLKGCFYMIFPLWFTLMAHDLCTIQKTMGYDVFALDNEFVVERAERFELVESFFWRKHIRDQYFAPSYGLLQSDKSSIFEILDFAFVNGMVLNGLFLVTTSQALYTNINSHYSFEMVNLYNLQF